MVELRCCTGADAPPIVQALNECLYQGYRFRIVMTEERFLEDSAAHEVDLGSTVLAFDGARPVGVALTARRGDRGWLAGMGVHPSFRGRRLGREILRRAMDRLGESGARTVALEVLLDNEPARRRYAEAGFAAERRYLCFRGVASQAGPPSGLAVRSVRPADLLERYPESHHAEQCWQRELETLRRRAPALSALVAESKGRPVASLIYSGTALQDVAYWPDGPRLAEALPDLLHAAYGPVAPFAVVNVPDDDPLYPVLRAAGYEVYADQLDMRCRLGR